MRSRLTSKFSRMDKSRFGNEVVGGVASWSRRADVIAFFVAYVKVRLEDDAKEQTEECVVPGKSRIKHGPKAQVARGIATTKKLMFAIVQETKRGED